MIGGALPAQARQPGRWSWVSEGGLAAVRGLVLSWLALAGVALAALLAVGLAAAAWILSSLIQDMPQHAWEYLLLPGIVLAPPGLRGLAVLTRRLAGEWCGVVIPAPYRAASLRPGERERPRRRAARLLSDRASWRDLLWLVLNACGGVLLAAAPFLLVAGGLLLMAFPVLAHLAAVSNLQAHALPQHATPTPSAASSSAGLLSAPGSGSSYRPTDPGSGLEGNALALSVPAGLALVALGLWEGPRLLPAYGAFAGALLGPTRRAELALRVEHLAQTRSESVDTSAAELRRIERDLHDGAQARLVAMGMTLDAADQLLDTSPAAARALLAEARESSARALADLRNLVRGIHPPVLADRGLAEAIKALALDSPFRVNFSSELTGRPPAPIETAAYFAVSELLANVSKHAGARQAWIDLRHGSGMLSVGVSDDGAGGADPDRGSGLRGIERRLASFDGVLAVSSPPGGPTVVNMEIPCALSSPKTSSC
jgi:signal transduction histidine kinase